MIATLSTRILLLGRIFAVLSLAVFSVGKSVHVHQECGGCCGTHASVCESTEPSLGEEYVCPFGCTHHRAGGPIVSECGNSKDDDSQGGDPSKHEEHRCPVCSLLAQAPQNVCAVSAPELCDDVVDTLKFSSDAARSEVAIAATSRGPPAV